MSGTSLDGLSIASISINKPAVLATSKLKKIVRAAVFLDGKTYDFPKKLQNDLRTIASAESQVHTSFIARSHAEFGWFSANCVKKFVGTGKKQLDIIGFHGQTVYHEPGSPTTTFQLGDPSPICFTAECPVVSDFRTMDTAAGGQGAPLVPIVDYLRYSDHTKSRIVLNLGGIANITYLPRGGTIDDVRAFDVGPANILIDGAVRALYSGQKTKDDGGSLAQKGKVSKEFLDHILKLDDFRFLPIPKSTGRERYSQTFLKNLLDYGENKIGLSKEDIIATVSSYSLYMVDYHIKKLLGNSHEGLELIVGGGGVRNKFLLQGLEEISHALSVMTHDTFDVPARFWECFCFAVMAYLSYHHVGGNVPSGTGASSQVVLGRINYPMKYKIN